MKTTLLILTAMLIAGSVDAAGAKKRKVQDAFEGNAVPTTKERMKVDAQEKKCENPIDKFVSTPGSVAEFELTHTVCPTNAIALYQDAAEKGNPIAQYFMGRALLYGIGCVTNASMAYAWAKKSADSGFATGINLLGVCYLDGAGVEKDPFAAYEMFRKAAEAGSLDGKLNLGYCYLDGTGVEKNETKAEELIKEAAEDGWTDAMAEMGDLYFFRKRDSSGSLSWYRKAAKAGSKYAKERFVFYCLGKAESHDVSVEEEEKAFVYKTCVEIVNDHWWCLESSRSLACAVLGQIFEHGWGMEVDLMQAMDWYEQAARLNKSLRGYAESLKTKLKKKYDESTIASMRKRYHQKKGANGTTKGMVQSHKESVRLTSFCGIKFGDLLPQTPILGDKRTKDGMWIVKTVKLQKPFRGMDHATVFASIKTRKICCVQLEWTTEGLGDDAVPEGKSVVEAVLKRFPDAEKIPRDMPDGFMNLHGDEYKVGGGTVSIGWVQSHFMSPPSRLQLTAKNDEFMRLAKEEYEQESGGDGSSVL